MGKGRRMAMARKYSQHGLAMKQGLSSKAKASPSRTMEICDRCGTDLPPEGGPGVRCTVCLDGEY